MGSSIGLPGSFLSILKEFHLSADGILLKVEET